jgi:hypothetical protein
MKISLLFYIIALLKNKKLKEAVQAGDYLFL